MPVCGRACPSRMDLAESVRGQQSRYACGLCLIESDLSCLDGMVLSHERRAWRAWDRWSSYSRWCDNEIARSNNIPRSEPNASEGRLNRNCSPPRAEPPCQFRAVGHGRPVVDVHGSDGGRSDGSRGPGVYPCCETSRKEAGRWSRKTHVCHNA